MRSILVLFLLAGLLLPASTVASAEPENETVYEIQVRGLPPAGRAWPQTRPVQALPDVVLQNIDMDRSMLVVRVSGSLDRDALEQALTESGLMMVYLRERSG